MYVYVYICNCSLTHANSTTLYIIIGYGIQFKLTTHFYDVIVFLILYVLLYM